MTKVYIWLCASTEHTHVYRMAEGHKMTLDHPLWQSDTVCDVMLAHEPSNSKILPSENGKSHKTSCSKWQLSEVNMTSAWISLWQYDTTAWLIHTQPLCNVIACRWHFMLIKISRDIQVPYWSNQHRHGYAKYSESQPGEMFLSGESAVKLALKLPDWQLCFTADSNSIAYFIWWLQNES